MIYAKGQAKDKSVLWHRDSFQIRLVLRAQGHSTDKDRSRAGSFTVEEVSLFQNFEKSYQAMIN